uniref:Uncharacterized protein n=1 Tax=Aegilops tauschii subsp. strangulata TaxID=200361 RepID=A0A453M618_AEGTS
PPADLACLPTTEMPRRPLRASACKHPTQPSTRSFHLCLFRPHASMPRGRARHREAANMTRLPTERMARTKCTARKSTGGKAPTKHLRAFYVILHLWL